MKCKMIAAAVGILFIFACAQIKTFTKEPQSEDDCLVIGQVQFYCYLTRTGSIPIGHYRYGVKLEFADMESGRVIRVRTVDPKGFFYFHNPESGQFYLKKISYSQSHVQPELHKKYAASKKSASKKTRGASASITPRRKIVYIIEKNKVNNLGQIEWKGNMRDRKHEINYNRAHEETKKEFAKKYPESFWNRSEWVNIFAKDEFY